MSASRPSSAEGGRAAAGGARPFRLRAVLFDFDGTLTSPGALDFPAIKNQVGCPPGEYLLEWILRLPPGAERDAAERTLERAEQAAADAAVPNENAEHVVHWLREHDLAVGILTRNGRSAVERSLRRFASLTAADFDAIVTRDDPGIAPKPAPDGVLHAAAAMGVSPQETLVVGDFLLDMQAGRSAGAVTAYLLNHGRPGHDAGAQPEAADCDFVVGRLAELRDVVRLGLPLSPGKLPNDILAGFLRGLPGDPALVVPAAVGEDAAAIDLAGAELLVAHGDPITLGGSDVAAATVRVSVNDIAAAGAEPRWLLTTVLLPTGVTPSEALALLGELAVAAGRSGVTLAGGHTEVTGSVTRPVVSTTALGTVPRNRLMDKRGVRPGDRILITEALAVEGTALLADELGERLLSLGLSAQELAACRALRERTSVLPEARIARTAAGVRAMHDVTEGGLATALRELAAATGRGVRVHRDRVPVGPETARVCALLGADPLGLIASGSLLICCDPAHGSALVASLEAAGIPAADIGELTEEGAGVVALERGLPAPWPEFATDEAARLLAQAAALPEGGGLRER
jgi:HAD superfamily hydrolase (TIGR01509 family)